MAEAAERIEVRRATPRDDEAVLSLLTASLGWVPDDQYRAFFDWKHRQNPFGESPAWVACLDEEVVGYRTFLRWELLVEGATKRAVRAVDTATHPDHQGKGIFRTLTTGALDDLAADGVDFVFNTPNDQSRPGYLKMGWRLIGRLPVLARPTGPRALIRMARARVPADKWSQPCSGGGPALEVLADDAAVEGLLASVPAGSAATTRRSAAQLRWRYGFGPLHYRAVTLGPLGEGLAVFRLRRRGAATEAAVCELLVPGDDVSASRRLLAEVRRRTEVDYVVRLDDGVLGRSGAEVPVPGQGPTLTWRSVGDDEPPSSWRLSHGDVELF